MDSLGFILGTLTSVAQFKTCIFPLRTELMSSMHSHILIVFDRYSTTRPSEHESTGVRSIDCLLVSSWVIEPTDPWTAIDTSSGSPLRSRVALTRQPFTSIYAARERFRTLALASHSSKRKSPTARQLISGRLHHVTGSLAKACCFT